MNKLKCIIIEDEKESQAALQNLITTYCHNVEVISTYESVTSAMDFLNTYTVNLVFLDIELQGESGFNLFTFIPNPKFKIIFTTAYNQYAVKAFKFSAIDYLMKPIDLNELRSAITKVIELEEFIKTNELYNILIHNIKNGSNQIAITHQNGFDLINISDIVWLEAEVNYTSIHLSNGSKITVAKTLKHFEDYLDSNMFFRVSRSAIVNIRCISKFHKQNALTVTMTDRSTITVSEARKDELLSIYHRI